VKIRYRPTALAQLDAILEFIAARSPAAAHRVMARIKRSIDLLADFPRSSKASEVPGIHEMPIVRYPYIVLYTVDEMQPCPGEPLARSVEMVFRVLRRVAYAQDDDFLRVVNAA
jgi:toxin ParE1/3/4